MRKFAPVQRVPYSWNNSVGDQTIKYGGFWIRLIATIIDTLLLLCVMAPLAVLLYFFGLSDPEQLSSERLVTLSWLLNFLLEHVFSVVVVIAFWIYKQATPGKMLFAMKILDATTEQPASKGQLIGRYFAYIISTIPLGLGFAWIAFDKRKQGWHDKLAGTVVVKKEL